MKESNNATNSAIMGKVVPWNPYYVIDVGIGGGKWGFLLRQFGFQGEIDGIEINKKTIEALKVNDGKFISGTIYNNIYHEDCRNFDYSIYDLAIFADTLSYLSKQDAINVWNRCISECPYSLMTFPTKKYSNEQYFEGELDYMQNQTIWTTAEVLNSFNGIDSYEEYEDCAVFFCDSRIDI